MGILLTILFYFFRKFIFFDPESLLKDKLLTKDDLKSVNFGNNSEQVEYNKVLYSSKEKNYHWRFIRSIWSSVADLSIAPIQDFLGLDNSARMNVPSNSNGNWKWRVNKEDLSID